MFFFFFFKQKTAYEIKECDWSSDVCSSDLYYTAQGLRGKSLDDNLEYLIDKLLSCYPCTGSTLLDNDFQDSIIHQAVKIQREILYNIKGKI